MRSRPTTKVPRLGSPLAPAAANRQNYVLFDDVPVEWRCHGSGRTKSGISASLAGEGAGPMMTSLKMLHGLLRVVNDGVLLVGRQIAWIAMALMVAVIVIQVFFRYVLNGALPWPEEAARALMI